MGLNERDRQRPAHWKIERIGLITATAPIARPVAAPVVASIAAVGDRRCLKNGRQFAAWLGRAPKQRSSGCKARLFGISKRGDRYLRTLLIHRARAVVRISGGKDDAETSMKR